MMRSLWSGVSGLQAHQIAMDVEGNNIANVNTTGFKYSRANFSDMLSQTTNIATAPQGASGGKNPQQVGLGTQINSITRIFSQGSVQTTGKNTDLAIQGNGFFVVSPDSGTTYNYSRNGDFVFDANGNFTNNQGLIAQGWVRDKTTGEIDNTAPIGNIQIAPGLTTPARPSSVINLKANLNTGDSIQSYSPIRALDTTDGLLAGKDPERIDDFNVLFGADKNSTIGSVSSFNIKTGQGMTMSFDGGETKTQYRYTDKPADVGPAGTYTYTEKDENGVEQTKTGEVFNFRTTEDLRKQMQDTLQKTSPTATLTVNDKGKYEILNADAAGEDLSIQVGAIVDNNTDKNELFSLALGSLGGILTAGSAGSRTSNSIQAATHASSIDVFDSLGSKHTVRTEFRKEGYIYDDNGTKTGSQWHMTIKVPEPGDIGGQARSNIIEGSIVFNSDGSLASHTPTSITYTANNGSSPNQTISLNLGSSARFDGITSFDSASNTSGISQDGFTGGDLNGIRIDSSGVLVGSFTNGRSFGLGQIAMAKFTNNIGLESNGNGVYSQTANSGDPVIGQAAVGGRGFIQASALEMSNVDLSRSLTQLIVVQRGYQANSKTITTSDQMLNTLLQLKQ